MVAEELRELLRAGPFRPFTVYLPNDRSFSVRHPDFAVLTPRGRTLIVLHDGDEAFDILDVPLIARVEVHEPTASSS